MRRTPQEQASDGFAVPLDSKMENRTFQCEAVNLKINDFKGVGHEPFGISPRGAVLRPMGTGE